MQSYSLNAVAAALDCHPRTILRITTGEANPYWADGYDPDVNVEELALHLGATPASLVSLLKEEDKALTVEETAALLKCKPAEFYRKGVPPDWQVGRVKRYSLLRMSKLKG